MSWEKVKLGDICEITSSKRIFYSEYVDEGVPFYRSKEIIELSDGNAISEPLYISEHRYEEIKQKFGIPVEEDILLTSVGSIGIPYMVSSKDKFYFKDGNLTWFRKYKDCISPQYLLYWLKSDAGYQVLNNLALGSAQRALTIAKLKNIEVPCPDLSTQKRIASILSAYDDLIEVNRKQIKLLEEAAERLYREWFIDLRFPGHETATFNADGLPEGWRKENIGNSFDLYLGGTPSRDNSNFWDNGTIPWINSGAVNKSRIIEGNELITELALEKSATKLLPKHCTLVAITGATLGQVSYNEIETCANQSVVAIKEKSNVYDEYMFHFVKHNIEGIINKANGSAQQHINKGILEEYMIILPDVKIIKEYHNRAKLFDQGIFNLMLQSKQAAEARDLLLPRLMNGEIQL